VWLLRRPAHSVSRRTRPSALVAVHELRGPQRAAQDLELVRVPPVVLVAQRNQLRLARSHLQRTFEVAVEAHAAVRARHDEALVACHHVLQRGEALGTGVIVGDHAHPAAVGLRTQRLDLRAEEGEVGLVGGHADGDQVGIRGAPERRSRAALGDVDQAQRHDVLDPVGQPRRELDVHRAALLAGLDWHRAPEPAAKRAWLGGEEVGPRHAHGDRPVTGAVDQDRDRHDLLLAVKARPAAEDRRGGPRRNRRGKRALQFGDKVSAHQRGNLSLRRR